MALPTIPQLDEDQLQQLQPTPAPQQEAALQPIIPSQPESGMGEGMIAPAKPEPSKEQFHAEMRDFDDRLAANRGATMALDPNDPNYLSKLAAHHAQQGLIKSEKAQFEQAHPWGSPESAHPGVGGKIGHVLGEIGQTAGEAFAPQIVAAIPGTKLNLGLQEKAGEKEEAEGQKEAGQAATTEENIEKTAEMKDTVPVTLADGSTAHIPKGELAKYLSKVQPPEIANQGKKDVVEAQNAAKPQTTIAGLFHRADQEKQAGNEQAYQATLKEIYDLQNKPGSPYNIATELHKEHPDWTPEKIQKAMAKGTFPRVMPVNDEKGNIIGYNVIQTQTGGGAGMNFLPAGAGGAPLAAGVIPPKPTSGILFQSQMAASLIPEAENLTNEVDRITGDLGPLAGRWNEVMVGKVGADNLAVAGLLQDLRFFATAAVKTHFGGSAPEGVVRDLERDFRMAQSPEDLKARIAHIDQWFQTYKALSGHGEKKEEKKAGGPPEGAKVRDFTELK